MSDAGDEKGRSGPQNQSMARLRIASVMGIMLLLIVSTTPIPLEASSFSAGTIDDPTVPINCSHAVMTTAPTFLSAPKGSAKYPFSMKCTSPVRPGLMIFTWEGSWTPSETRRDRPNASESLTITGYEPFIPGRVVPGQAQGGKLFMYWTGSCTADPWLQGGGCSRFGEYMPEDLQAAFPDIGKRPFPLTGNSISPLLKQQLVKQYQAVNQPSTQLNNPQGLQSMIIQPQQSQVITQSQRTQAMAVQPQMASPKSSTSASSLARSGIFARGVEGKEGQTSGQQAKDTQSTDVETSDPAVLEEGTAEMAEPVVLTLDHPFHATTATGKPFVLTPGTYEVRPVLDVQLGLAREGQPTVLLHAHRGSHSESIRQTIAMAVPGEADEVYLVLMMSDGRRFDAHGSLSGVKSRNTDVVITLPDKQLQDAIQMTSTKPRSISPACQPNPADIGPRWIPVPCTMLVTPPAP